jgi:uncharacterized membrane protein YraQ (UPF0718 family)
MKVKFKGIKFLSIVVVLYAVLLLTDTTSTLLALQKGASILLSLLPLFLLIITLTALINYFLKPKQIIKHFGKESGVKGVLYALVGGIISHGPMYAWFAMLQDMRSHGLKDGLIAVFMYARAVKLPLLPFMVDLFGLMFTIIMTLYILIAAVIQGKIIDSVMKKAS